MTNYIERVGSLFFEYQNPADAIRIEVYMPSKFDFSSMKAPLRMALSRPFLTKGKRPVTYTLQMTTFGRWNKPFREFQYFGIDLLNRYDSVFSKANLQFIEKLVRQKPWWGTVDALQTVVDTIVQRWNNSDDFWLIRMSIPFQLKYKDKVNTDFLTKMSLNQSTHSGFFVQKVIGWALRQYEKYSAVWVRNFINTNTLSGLAKRETIKHF